MTSRSVTVVIPAWDELRNLEELIPALIASFLRVPAWSWSIHVILPCDVEPREEDSVQALGAVPVRRSPGNSFGDAIRTGISSVPVECEYVIVMDADGSHDPGTVPRLLAEAGRADVVVASRYVAGGRTDNPPILRLMSRTLNRTYARILGLNCRDISTNFKLYRRVDLQELALESAQFDIVEEILFRLAENRKPDELTIREIPDHFHERAYGRSKRRLGPFVAAYLVTLARLRMSSGWRRRPEAPQTHDGEHGLT